MFPMPAQTVPLQPDLVAPFRELDRYLRQGGDSSANYWLMGAAVAIAAALVILWVLERRKQRRFRPRPLRTFIQMARRLSLPWRDCWLLWRIARHRGLASPLTLLLCPATLHHHALEHGQDASARHRARLMARIESIRRRLEEPAG